MRLVRALGCYFSPQPQGIVTKQPLAFVGIDLPSGQGHGGDDLTDLMIANADLNAPSGCEGFARVTIWVKDRPVSENSSCRGLAAERCDDRLMPDEVIRGSKGDPLKREIL